ncbi:MAG: hypothetical protein HY862_12145 [Chloroflexi bacterium]|nr:hypothetical protein [Chloroflexota bacterium]
MSAAPEQFIQIVVAHPSSHVVGVRFQKLGKLYHFDYTDFPDIRNGDYVIVETVRGQQIGQIMGFVEREDTKRAYKPILRPATPRDLLIKQQLQSKEVSALIDCRELASKFGGFEEAKFVAAEYSFDGTNVAIMYSSEAPFNGNRLRSELQKKLRANIEFRQIGPRDVARILGGQGACGGPRCCSTFLTEFSPISIKMAKAQGVPLTPTEITGMCGRLRCCLIYEYEQYVEARKQLPKKNKLVGTPHGEGRVLEVFPLRDGVSVRFEGEDQVDRFVLREELIPLDEFRALKAKAEQGCTKNEGGGCDCGARRPKSATGDLAAALEMAHPPRREPLPPVDDDEEDEMHGEAVRLPEPRPAREPRHNRERRSRQQSGSGQGQPQTSNQPAPQTRAEGQQGQSNQPPKPNNNRNRHRRRGHRNPNQPPKGEGQS